MTVVELEVSLRAQRESELTGCTRVASAEFDVACMNPVLDNINVLLTILEKLRTAEASRWRLFLPNPPHCPDSQTLLRKSEDLPWTTRQPLRQELSKHVLLPELDHYEDGGVGRASAVVDGSDQRRYEAGIVDAIAANDEVERPLFVDIEGSRTTRFPGLVERTPIE